MKKITSFFLFLICLPFLIYSNTPVSVSNSDIKIRENVEFPSRAVCTFSVTPDLPLISSSLAIENEMKTAIKKYSDDYLGTFAPSTSNLSTAISQYNSFIGSGVAGKNLNSTGFLKVFAQELKYNPGNSTVKGYADNVIDLVSQAICDGTIDVDIRGYNYRTFGGPAILLGIMEGTDIVDLSVNTILTPSTKDKFAFTLYKTTNDLEHYWVDDYESDQLVNDAIDTDQIYNKSDILMVYSYWQTTDQERYRYMRGFQRYLNRFLTPSIGVTNGIKVDGSGFHHWTAYNSYMYAYRTVCDILSYLQDTQFQVGESNYKLLRDAVLVQRLQANDFGSQALSTCGRKPNERKANITNIDIRLLAIAGGKILGLGTADPVLAGFYNRVNGSTYPEFNYSTVSAFQEGFIQLNYSNAGFFRKKGNTKDWTAFTKGFTDGLWGAEIYPTSNRYGRYQSYGALEILYPGSLSANGYNEGTWDWNYNPGTTVIRYADWLNLRGEKGRIDESQQRRFAGALAFKKKKLDYLTDTYGQFGLFAMDFKEKANQGFSTVYGPNTHNTSFEFKKSNFFFDDIIVCLASEISNNDTNNPTVTTLYQRINNSGSAVYVNGTEYGSDGTQSFNGASNNWILSNYGTGFYVFSDNYDIKTVKGTQQTPDYTTTGFPTITLGSSSQNYYKGYIDHGTNPVNKGYEYIIKPNATLTEMQALHTTISGGNKPYTIHQKDSNAHIIEYGTKNIFGFAVFGNVSGITFGKVKSINNSCLLMYEFDGINNKILLSLSNPELGFQPRFYDYADTKIIRVVVEGEWVIDSADSDIQLISSNASQTILEFTTTDGNAYEVSLTNALGVSDFENLSKAIKLYPNPTQGTVKIFYNQPLQISGAEIYDLLGRKVFIDNKASSVSSEYILPIDLSQFNKSIYLVKIKTDKGDFTKRLIVE